MPVPPLLRTGGCLVGAALLLAPAAAAASRTPHPRIAAAACSGRDLVPTANNLVAVRTAIVCLNSQSRARHGLPLLVVNLRLRRAAVVHSADMVAKSYFEHTAPSGTTLVDRVVSAKYIRRNAAWVVGENLAWATGSDATPANIMKAWMASPGHRANILRRTYREVGVGIVAGVPSDRSVGVTYTTDFGARR
jgi:uncharacterized protein YkwD